MNDHTHLVGEGQSTENSDEHSEFSMPLGSGIGDAFLAPASPPS
jgi:hypothetical protein